MTIRDLSARLAVSQSLAPASRVTGTFTGTAADLRGFDSAMILVAFGAGTDGTHTPSLQHSVDGTTYAACTASDLDGSFSSAIGTAASSTLQKVGYIGDRRFVRVVMTVTGASTGALSAASVVAGEPHNFPVT